MSKKSDSGNFKDMSERMRHDSVSDPADRRRPDDDYNLLEALRADSYISNDKARRDSLWAPLDDFLRRGSDLSYSVDHLAHEYFKNTVPLVFPLTGAGKGEIGVNKQAGAIWSNSQIPALLDPENRSRQRDFSFFIEYFAAPAAGGVALRAGVFLNARLIRKGILAAPAGAALADSQSRIESYRRMIDLAETAATAAAAADVPPPNGNRAWDAAFAGFLLAAEDAPQPDDLAIWESITPADFKWHVSAVPFCLSPISGEIEGYGLKWHFFLTRSGTLAGRFIPEPVADRPIWRSDDRSGSRRAAFADFSRAAFDHILRPCIFGWGSLAAADGSGARITKSRNVRRIENASFIRMLNRRANLYGTDPEFCGGGGQSDDDCLDIQELTDSVS